MLAAGAGHVELLAYAAPVFVLAVPLLAGRYVGEDAARAAEPAPRRTHRRVARRAVGAVRRSAGSVPAWWSPDRARRSPSAGLPPSLTCFRAGTRSRRGRAEPEPGRSGASYPRRGRHGAGCAVCARTRSPRPRGQPELQLRGPRDRARHRRAGGARSSTTTTGSSCATGATAVVIVEGYRDEPYLRFRPDGTVQVNRRSPACYLNQDRFARCEVPRSADPKPTPSGRRSPRNGRYDWHDHRIHWMANGPPPPQRKDESKRAKMFDWKLPVCRGGQPAAIDGTLTWLGKRQRRVPARRGDLAGGRRGRQAARSSCLCAVAANAAGAGRRRLGEARSAPRVGARGPCAARPAASAHAVLEASQPSRGDQVPRAPERVTLRFDEPVEVGVRRGARLRLAGQRGWTPARPSIRRGAGLGGRRPARRPRRRHLHGHLPGHLGRLAPGHRAASHSPSALAAPRPRRASPT